VQPVLLAGGRRIAAVPRHEDLSTIRDTHHALGKVGVAAKPLGRVEMAPRPVDADPDAHLPGAAVQYE